MIYYELTDYYKRDVYFVFDEEKNGLDYFALSDGCPIVYNYPVYYTIDKIDSYIDKYDLLPTLGPLLVSSKFKYTFSSLENSEIQFFNAVITDKKGNNINDFYTMNITNAVECLDLDKSVIEMTKYGTRNIKKKIFLTDALKNFSIVRMKEHKSYIIVTEWFKNKCEDTGLKGIMFLEEGYTIYKDI
jgi:hypothetical protein